MRMEELSLLAVSDDDEQEEGEQEDEIYATKLTVFFSRSHPYRQSWSIAIFFLRGEYRNSHMSGRFYLWLPNSARSGLRYLPSRHVPISVEIGLLSFSFCYRAAVLQFVRTPSLLLLGIFYGSTLPTNGILSKCLSIKIIGHLIIEDR